MENLTNVDVILEGFTGEFSFENTSLINTKISRFSVDMPVERIENKINGVLNQQVSLFFEYVSGKFYEDAKENYIKSKTGEFPFRTFDSVLNYTVSYNENCFLSDYRDEYYFTGGAHGSTIRKSDTWNTKTGNIVFLSSFFKGDFINRITDEIINQAEMLENENPNTLFDNYKDLIKQNFNLKQFYLTNDGIVIYFQQYDIAPYSSGILTFTIPYEDVDYPPTC